MGPDLQFENLVRSAGSSVIAGVDEVGRGPLAGPVVAAAVILDMSQIPNGMNDSKKLSQATRERLFDLILAQAQVGIGEASVAEIDDINILRASHLAMCRAIAALKIQPDHVLIDGNLLPRGLNLPATAVIKGDAKSLSIAAASIIAKVTRDKMMVDLAQQFPGYGWETNSGYPTAKHLERLKSHGVTPHHRTTFAPVHNILYQAKIINS